MTVISLSKWVLGLGLVLASCCDSGSVTRGSKSSYEDREVLISTFYWCSPTGVYYVGYGNSLSLLVDQDGAPVPCGSGLK